MQFYTKISQDCYIQFNILGIILNHKASAGALKNTILRGGNYENN